MLYEVITIRFALLAIKSLGRGVIRNIILERNINGKFKSIQDFCTRMYGKDLNSRAIEALIMCGAFDSFPTNRRQMLQNYDRIIIGLSDQNRHNVEGQFDLFGFNDTKSVTTNEMEIPYVEEYSFLELLEMEKNSAGIYISGHPLSNYSYFMSAAKLNTVTQIIENAKENVTGFNDGDKVKILCLLQNKKMFTTRSGTQMCFVNFEDMTGSIEGVVFPKIYDLYKSLLVNSAILEITGHISLKDEEDAKIIVDIIQTADKFLQDCKLRPLCIKLNSMDIDKYQRIKEIALKNQGTSKLYLYFDDLKKLIIPNDFKGVDITSEFIMELCSFLGSENVAFK